MSLSAVILCPQHCIWGALAHCGCYTCSYPSSHYIQWWSVGFTSTLAWRFLMLSLRLAYMHILWICFKVFTKMRRGQKEGRKGLLGPS